MQSSEVICPQNKYIICKINKYDKEYTNFHPRSYAFKTIIHLKVKDDTKILVYKSISFSRNIEDEEKIPSR